MYLWFLDQELKGFANSNFQSTSWRYSTRLHRPPGRVSSHKCRLRCLQVCNLSKSYENETGLSLDISEVQSYNLWWCCDASTLLVEQPAYPSLVISTPFGAAQARMIYHIMVQPLCSRIYLKRRHEGLSLTVPQSRVGLQPRNRIATCAQTHLSGQDDYE